MITANSVKQLEVEIDSRDLSDASKVELFMNEVIDWFWNRSKGDLSKKSAFQHFNPQSHIRAFSDNGVFTVLTTPELKSQGSNSTRYVEMAFAKSESPYSLKMEDFLGRLEGVVSGKLSAGAMMTKNRTVIKNRTEFEKKIVKNKQFRVFYCLFLAAQWHRTKFALNQLRPSRPSLSVDEIILQGMKQAAHELWDKRWLWIPSTGKQLLWLPPPSSFHLSSKNGGVKPN